MARAEQDIVEAGAMGAAFDIEGGVYPRDMLKWIKDMRVKHPSWSCASGSAPSHPIPGPRAHLEHDPHGTIVALQMCTCRKRPTSQSRTTLKVAARTTLRR